MSWLLAIAVVLASHGYSVWTYRNPRPDHADWQTGLLVRLGEDVYLFGRGHVHVHNGGTMPAPWAAHYRNGVITQMRWQDAPLHYLSSPYVRTLGSGYWGLTEDQACARMMGD
jgi:hypothetical protein